MVAVRVANSCEGVDDLMTLKSEVLEADFKVSAVGTLVTGQWFAENANTSKVSGGEYPMLLVTGGLLHQVPSLLPNHPFSAAIC